MNKLSSLINHHFYRAACIACLTQYSHEKAVCPFVRLSVKRVICDKTEER